MIEDKEQLYGVLRTKIIIQVTRWCLAEIINRVGAIFTVRWDALGTKLVTASDDKTVKVIHVGTNKIEVSIASADKNKFR